MKPTMPGTRALRTFAAAGRHLNFTRAADEVGLTPAAVSYQIKEIEEQLGLALFTRSSRAIQLTPAGAVLLEAANEALANLQMAIGRARRMHRGTAQLRVSLGARFATNWLLPRLPSLRAAHPHLELTFDITDEVRDFDADDIDVAIRFGAGGDTSACSTRLFNTEVVPICAPALLENGARLKEPRDLLQHTLCHVDCRVDGMVWPNWPMWMAAAGIEGLDESRCIAFADTSHVIQAVVDGNAVGLAEPAMIAQELARGRVVRLFDLGIGMERKYAYHLVYPERSHAEPGIAAFRAWLLSEVEAANL